MTEGVLGVCGVRNIVHRAFYQVTTITSTERQAVLDQVRELTVRFERRAPPVGQSRYAVADWAGGQPLWATMIA